MNPGRQLVEDVDRLSSRQLRERLLAAEETLHAIRRGEVDAFVVAGGVGSRVVLLEGAEHPYIALMERINEGAVTLSRDGEIRYCNRFLAEFLRIPRDRMTGRPFRDLVATRDRADFDRLLARGAHGGSHGGLTLLAPDGALREVQLSLSPLGPALDPSPAPDLRRAGVIGIVTNLDDLKTAARSLEVRVRQQAGLAELGQRALSGGPLDALLGEATHFVTRTLDASYSLVLELLPEGDQLRIRAATGVPESQLETVVPGTANSPSWLALRSGQAVVVDDLATDPRFAGWTVPEGWQAVSVLAVAVPGDDVPFGVLAAASPDPRRFSDDDAHFLQTVANVLAAAILRQRSEALRRWLLDEVTRSRDDERRRLARELHDETRQSLWAVVVGLNALETVAEEPAARDAAQRLHAIASRTLDDIGRLARGLHPGALDDHGLAAAATQYLRDFTASYGIAVVPAVEPERERLAPDVEITLYRILQEALTNVARHAQAQVVRVTLRREAHVVELIVADDGIGYRAAPVRDAVRPGGFGLHGMRERVQMLGGEVIVASPPPGGTRVTVRIPLTAGTGR